MIQYTLMDPSGNRTVLCETPVPKEAQPAVAEQLMRLEPTAEQVGFTGTSETADVALRMAGGEFCANASASTAVLFGIRTGRTSGTVTVEASGAGTPVIVRVEAQTNRLWRGIVQMPPPQRVQNMCLSDGRTYPVVTFPGITHVLVQHSIPRAQAEQYARRWCRELHADALGLMFWSPSPAFLTPLVYVPRADTMVWEKACGSGTTALGAYLALESGEDVCVSLRQPGGVLEISASPDGVLRLQGAVRHVHTRTADVAF